MPAGNVTAARDAEVDYAIKENSTVTEAGWAALTYFIIRADSFPLVIICLPLRGFIFIADSCNARNRSRDEIDT